jgi:hypothetical protein
MAEPFTTSRLREAPAGEAAARIASRRKTPDQRLRILERLTMGLSVARRAWVEQLTARRAPQIIADMLASRETDPPADFVQLQVARLSKAMIVARTTMMQGNLHSTDRWAELTSELDRYHRFSPAQVPRARDAAPPPRRLEAKLTAKRSRPEMAPQRLEKIESGPGNGSVSEASNPQDVVHGRVADRARLRLMSRQNDETAIQVGKFSASQPLEIAKNRERISESGRGIGT